MCTSIKKTVFSSFFLLAMMLTSVGMASELRLSVASLAAEGTGPAVTSEGLTCYAPPSETWVCDFEQPVDLPNGHPACCCVVGNDSAKNCGPSATDLYACELHAGDTCSSMCRYHEITTCLPWPGDE